MGEKAGGAGDINEERSQPDARREPAFMQMALRKTRQHHMVSN
jgi:hypothetical protein